MKNLGKKAAELNVIKQTIKEVVADMNIGNELFFIKVSKKNKDILITREGQTVSYITVDGDIVKTYGATVASKVYGVWTSVVRRLVNHDVNWLIQ